MKRLLSIIAILLCLAMLAPMGAGAAQPGFTDISEHWAEDIIQQFARENIVFGFPDGTFRPNHSITRAEFTALLVRTFDLSETHPFEFDDVSASDWYYGYLVYAARFISDRDFGEFRFAGNHSASRIDVAEALVLITLYLEGFEVALPAIEEIQAELRSTFRDVEFRTGEIHLPNVQRIFTFAWLAHQLGIIEGCCHGFFNPHSGISRAELLTALDRVR